MYHGFRFPILSWGQGLGEATLLALSFVDPLSLRQLFSLHSKKNRLCKIGLEGYEINCVCDDSINQRHSKIPSSSFGDGGFPRADSGNTKIPLTSPSLKTEKLVVARGW